MQVTDLFRNSDKFGPFFDTTDGEEPDPGSDPINDDVSYKVSGDSLTLQPVYDDNTESDWQECLSCLNVAGVASNVDASCLEVEAALGVNTDNLDLLGTLAEPMAVLEQREKCETTVHTCGKYQPLLLLLAIMLSTQQQKKRDIDRSLRGAERRKKFVKSQTKDALAGVYKLSSVFHRVSSAPEPDIPDGPQLRSRKRGVVSLKNLAGRPVKKSKKVPQPKLLSDADLIDLIDSGSESECVILGQTKTSRGPVEPLQTEKLSELGLKALPTEALGNCCPLSVGVGFGKPASQSTSDYFRELAAAELYLHPDESGAWPMITLLFLRGMCISHRWFAGIRNGLVMPFAKQWQLPNNAQ
ncbi:hypothetical protein CYMTET_50324 [Cymbomonas tetramitiformis]|uniref:Uncharacterized protein n=1 Tax=Cymbomonas tetramitiformis TaxID=36881 RepID=A0AAE0BPI1_9CHLO|nr:hypothetical protein CYMTET_50324 [Cymbomonas tetramitiformis]